MKAKNSAISRIKLASPPADAWSTGVEASASQHLSKKDDQDHKHAHGVAFRKMDSSPVSIQSTSC